MPILKKAPDAKPNSMAPTTGKQPWDNWVGASNPPTLVAPSSPEWLKPVQMTAPPIPEWLKPVSMTPIKGMKPNNWVSNQVPELKGFPGGATHVVMVGGEPHYTDGENILGKVQ